MKIIYCINSLYKSGGMERILTTKANWLADNGGCEVIIAVHNDNKEPFFQLSPKVSVVPLYYNNNKDYKIKLEKMLNSERPDITVSLFGDEASFLYKIHDGSKKFLEFHFTRYYLRHLINGISNLRFRFLHKIKGEWIQLQNKLVMRHYSNVILLTKQDMGLWGNRTNTDFIHNPLTFRSKDKSNLKTHRIIAAGRLISQKGFDILIEAFSPLAAKYPDWVIDIYGNGQDYKQLLDMIVAHHLERRITLHDSVKDIRKEYLSSSIFAFPSRYEGFGLVLTEAMECGLPCVSFDCECGPREIIDESCGILVADKDVESFSSALEKLMNDEKLRIKMGNNAIEHVKRFYPDAIMPIWLDKFHRAIE